MSVAAAALLALGVAAAWLGAFAMLRLPALSRLHALGFVNVAGGATVTLAVCCKEGASAASAKMLFVWIVLLAAGALSSHVSARALHLRGGDGL